MRALYASVVGLFVGTGVAFGIPRADENAMNLPTTIDGTIERYDASSRTIVIRSDIFGRLIQVVHTPDVLRYTSLHHMQTNVAIAHTVHKDTAPWTPGMRVVAISPFIDEGRIMTEAIVTFSAEPL